MNLRKVSVFLVMALFVFSFFTPLTQASSIDVNFGGGPFDFLEGLGSIFDVGNNDGDDGSDGGFVFNPFGLFDTGDESSDGGGSGLFRDVLNSFRRGRDSNSDNNNNYINDDNNDDGDDGDGSNPSVGNGNNATTPTWETGETWIYSINADINLADNINAKVNMGEAKFVMQGEQGGNYKLALTVKDMSGSGKYDMGGISISGDLKSGEIKKGTVLVDKSTLGIAKAEGITFDGKAFVVGVGVDAEIGINPSSPVSYLQFPFNEGDTWTRSAADGSYSLYMKIANGIMEQDVEYPFSVKKNNFECVGTQDKNGYSSYKIEGDLGSTIYYSPEAKNIVQAEFNDIKLYLGNLTSDTYWTINSVTVSLEEYGKTSDPPKTPDKPSGPSTGGTGKSYTFSASTTDPNGDKIKYVFDWGDEETSETSLVASGESASASHSWSAGGVYEVRVKAVDENGAESEWSDPAMIDISGEGGGGVNFSVKICRLHEIGELDPWFKGGVDWAYKVSVYTGKGWITRIHECPDGHDTYHPDKEYTFQVTTGEPKVKIKAWDRDIPIKNPITGEWIDYHDLADVSAHAGGGNEDGLPDKRGAIYHGVYKLAEHEISSNFNSNNDDWTRVNGKYETQGGQSPKASVRFEVSDDYHSPTVDFVKPETTGPFFTNETIEFEAEVTDGLAPFTWNWDFGDGESSSQRAPSHAFDEAGDYWVNVTVIDSAGVSASDELHITVDKNLAPWTPDKPSGPSVTRINKECVYSAGTTDPDGHKVAFGWDWNGDSQVDEWDDNNGDYYTGSCDTVHVWKSTGSKSVKVKAKDIYGAESDWSDPLPVAVPYDNQKRDPSAVAGGPYVVSDSSPSVSFDASDSVDNDDGGDSIRWIRWDFDGDGSWDTGSWLTLHWVRFDGNKVISKDLSGLLDEDDSNSDSDSESSSDGGDVTSLGVGEEEDGVSQRIYFAKLEVKDDEGDKAVDTAQVTVTY